MMAPDTGPAPRQKLDLFSVVRTDGHLVDVAPRPVLIWLCRPHHRMIGMCRRMLRGVLIGRAVATTDRLARGAVAQVHPRRTDGETLDTTARFDRFEFEINEVFTRFGHETILAHSSDA